MCHKLTKRYIAVRCSSALSCHPIFICATLCLSTQFFLYTVLSRRAILIYRYHILVATLISRSSIVATAYGFLWKQLAQVSANERQDKCEEWSKNVIHVVRQAHAPRVLCIHAGTVPLQQWFPKCGSRPQGICDQFPGDSWLHFCNDYFEFYLFFKLRKCCF